MRICTKCRYKGPDSAFANKFKTNKRGLCKKCKSLYNKDWYGRNKKKHLVDVVRNNRKYRKLIRAAVDKLKERPCSDCGRRFPPCAMDFDHRHPGAKWMEVAHLATRSTSLAPVLREIKKCDLVCAVCHRIRTWNRLQKRPHGRTDKARSS